MEYSNFYTVETLQNLNDAHDYRYDVSESDTEKVNSLISLIQKERENQKEPVAGDMIEFTTRSGDYYNRAHIERIKDGCLEICLSPHTPFCYDDVEQACYDTSGGPWTHLDNTKPEPARIKAKLFKTWGHCGRCASGAVYFKTFVRSWRYTESKPVFGGYTTKDWTKYFISKMPDPERPGEYTYISDGFTIYTDTEFNRLVQILHGELFDGIYRNSLVLWGYRMDWEFLTEEEWNRIKADVHFSFLGDSPVKIQTEQEKHQITIYKKCAINNSI